MKRFLSWIVLTLSIIVCSLAISAVSYYGLKLAVNLYDYSRGIFWTVLILGGSFGLALAYYVAFLTAPLCVRLSNAISHSKKGARYKVLAIITMIYFAVNIISAFILRMRGIQLASAITTSVLMIIFGITLMTFGKDEAISYEN